MKIVLRITVLCSCKRRALDAEAVEFLFAGKGRLLVVTLTPAWVAIFAFMLNNYNLIGMGLRAASLFGSLKVIDNCVDKPTYKMKPILIDFGILC